MMSIVRLLMVMTAVDMSSGVLCLRGQLVVGAQLFTVLYASTSESHVVTGPGLGRARTRVRLRLRPRHAVLARPVGRRCAALGQMS